MAILTIGMAVTVTGTAAADVAEAMEDMAAEAMAVGGMAAGDMGVGDMAVAAVRPAFRIEEAAAFFIAHPPA